MSMHVRHGSLRPAYYVGDGGIEPFHVIRDWWLDFLLGNAVKYILRAGRKGAASADIRKALTYVEIVRIDIANGNSLREWLGRPRAYHPVAVASAFSLSPSLAIALGAIHDLSLSRVRAWDAASVAENSLRKALSEAEVAEAAAHAACERRRQELLTAATNNTLVPAGDRLGEVAA